MNVFAWILIGWYSLSAVLIVSRIGKESKPTTPGGAALSLVIMGVIGWLIVLAATS